MFSLNSPAFTALLFVLMLLRSPVAVRCFHLTVPCWKMVVEVVFYLVINKFPGYVVLAAFVAALALLVYAFRITRVIALCLQGVSPFDEAAYAAIDEQAHRMYRPDYSHVSCVVSDDVAASPPLHGASAPAMSSSEACSSPRQSEGASEMVTSPFSSPSVNSPGPLDPASPYYRPIVVGSVLVTNPNLISAESDVVLADLSFDELCQLEADEKAYASRNMEIASDCNSPVADKKNVASDATVFSLSCSTLPSDADASFCVVEADDADVDAFVASSGASVVSMDPFGEDANAVVSAAATVGDDAVLCAAGGAACGAVCGAVENGNVAVCDNAAVNGFVAFGAGTDAGVCAGLGAGPVLGAGVDASAAGADYAACVSFGGLALSAPVMTGGHSSLGFSAAACLSSVLGIKRMRDEVDGDVNYQEKSTKKFKICAALDPSAVACSLAASGPSAALRAPVAAHAADDFILAGSPTVPTATEAAAPSPLAEKMNHVCSDDSAAFDMAYFVESLAGALEEPANTANEQQEMDPTNEELTDEFTSALVAALLSVSPGGETPLPASAAGAEMSLLASNADPVLPNALSSSSAAEANPIICNTTTFAAQPFVAPTVDSTTIEDVDLLNILCDDSFLDPTATALVKALLAPVASDVAATTANE